MSIELPKPIALYMESINTTNNAILDACIAKDAHVYDRGEDKYINGLEAIKIWRGNVREEFNLQSEVVNVEEKQGIIIVTSITSGDFPGSPQLFYYQFTLEEDLIAKLEIVPGERTA